MERQMDERLNLTKYMIRDEMDSSDIRYLNLNGSIYREFKWETREKICVY